MINISHLTFNYPQSKQPALVDISFHIPPATLTLVTGASGSGKSTLLRTLNGLVPHFSGGTIQGDVWVNGKNPVSAGAEGMAPSIGFVFQEPEAQFVFDIVEDEIAFGLENMGMPRDEMIQRITEICQQLDLETIRHQPVNQISGGEMQRVAIASALVSQPKILILDEPTSQLDPFAADEVLEYVVSLQKSLGLTVVIAEHRLERLLPYTDLILSLELDHRFHFGKPQTILPTMALVPPLIAIGRKLNLSPLPLSEETFPQSTFDVQNVALQKPTPATSQPLPCLQMNGLTTKLGGKLILNKIDLNLNQGEITILLGPNGSGKTTLLRSILGLVPSEGDRYLFNQHLGNATLNEIIEQIAYLPQNPSDLLFAESVLDELKLTLRNHQKSASDDTLMSFLEKFDLASHSLSYPRDLSVGELQRTALAAITIHEPRVLLLDEPTRGLDYQNKINLIELLRDWRDQGKVVLVVTHDIEFAAHLADKVAILEGGEIVFNGIPKVAFSSFPRYQSQTARLFPDFGWIIPEEVYIQRSL